MIFSNRISFKEFIFLLCIALKINGEALPFSLIQPATTPQETPIHADQSKQQPAKHSKSEQPGSLNTAVKKRIIQTKKAKTKASTISKKRFQLGQTKVGRALAHLNYAIKFVGLHGAWSTILPKALRIKRIIGTVRIVDIASYVSFFGIIYGTYVAGNKTLSGLHGIHNWWRKNTSDNAEKKPSSFVKPPSTTPWFEQIM